MSPEVTTFFFSKRMTVAQVLRLKAKCKRFTDKDFLEFTDMT